MKTSLQRKLIVSYLVVALLTVLVASVLIRINSGQSLMNLVMEQQTALLEESILTYYAANGTLDGFSDPMKSNFEPKDAPPPTHQDDDEGFSEHVSGGGREVRAVVGLVDADYRALIPTMGHDVGEVIQKEWVKEAVPVEVDGEVIAWILPDRSLQFKLSADEEMFLQRSNKAIALAALAGVLAAVLIGIYLARMLLKPIRLLTGASRALASGSLNQQVPVSSQDELGLLTTTFNQMSADLARVDQERKRMTADITHDLSTPLQIISGYIDMLAEGEVTLTPKRLEIIKTEIEHLRRLVGDLTMLSQVESGVLEIMIHPVQPLLLLERVFQTYYPIAAHQGVELQLDVPESLPAISVDEGRMVQVLKNLLENALRHTPKGGLIKLAAAIGSDKEIHIQVQDSGAGIEAEDLPYVFDRFYRADKARGASAGKMGLGLAICKALVIAQGGSIAAESAGAGQGTTMVIRFEK